MIGKSCVLDLNATDVDGDFDIPGGADQSLFSIF